MKNTFRSPLYAGRMAEDEAGNICRILGNGTHIGRVRVSYAEGTQFELITERSIVNLKPVDFSAEQLAFMQCLSHKAFELMRRMSNGTIEGSEAIAQAKEMIDKLGTIKETVKYANDPRFGKDTG